MTKHTISDLNDQLRTDFIGGQILLTSGVAALAENVRGEVMKQVRHFDNFTEDNDPYGEHDFGAFDHPEAGKLFWKIDYYAPDMERGSEDPSDPKQTRRVLTIMLAGEY